MCESIPILDWPGSWLNGQGLEGSKTRKLAMKCEEKVWGQIFLKGQTK